MSKIECVSRAICNAAGRTVSKGECVMCERTTFGLECTMWKTFKDEARAAIHAVKTHKEAA